MPEASSYEHVRATAAQLQPAERLRLIAELANELAAEAKPSEREPPSRGDRLWSGSLVVNDRNVPTDQLIIANGIDAETGAYLLQLDPAGARRVAQEIEQLPEEQEHITAYKQRRKSEVSTLGLTYNIPHDDLTQAGWAVVVAESDSTELLDALAPLITYRCKDQGIEPPVFDFQPNETCGSWFYRQPGVREGAFLVPMRGESKLPVLIYDPEYSLSARAAPPGSCRGWLARYNVSAGPVDPKNGLPFYLMIAGRPGPIHQGDQAYIPFHFQYDLDIFWGVGRLCFTQANGEHDYAAYRAYAEHVVAYEQEQEHKRLASRQRNVVYFATSHERDPSTNLSEAQLVFPLAGLDPAQSGPSLAAAAGFTQTVYAPKAGTAATKETLGRILTGQSTEGAPTVLFTATHGIGLRPHQEELAARQGALICQGWERGMKVSNEFLFSANSFDELGDAARVQGMVAILFACYSAGCPRSDTYSIAPGLGTPQTLAPYDLVARLPQRMLARGALAVLGHVDRAWSYGFTQSALGITSQPDGFAELLKRLLNRERLGYVTDQLNVLQSTHAAAILKVLEDARHDQSPTKLLGLDTIGELWKAYHDLRSYMLLGDPAVKVW